jgi:hypothetical protein
MEIEEFLNLLQNDWLPKMGLCSRQYVNLSLLTCLQMHFHYTLP